MDDANAMFVCEQRAGEEAYWAKINGLRRFERSERGCPSVDISQLQKLRR